MYCIRHNEDCMITLFLDCLRRSTHFGKWVGFHCQVKGWGVTKLGVTEKSYSVSLNETKPVSHSSNIHHQHNSSEMNSLCVNDGTRKGKAASNSETLRYFNIFLIEL